MSERCEVAGCGRMRGHSGAHLTLVSLTAADEWAERHPYEESPEERAERRAAGLAVADLARALYALAAELSNDNGNEGTWSGAWTLFVGLIDREHAKLRAAIDGAEW